MNELNALNSKLLYRFFDRFQSIIYHGAPVSKFIYLDLITNWQQALLEKNPPWLAEIKRLNDSQVYHWADEPYNYEPHPEGVILMRGGFGDIASIYLPPERCFLISPNQAEVDLIKLNRPDLVSHNITDYFRENPLAVESLNRQIAQIINEQKDDPLFGSLAFHNWFKDPVPQIVRYLDAVQLLFETIKVGAVLTVSSVYSMDGALNLVARANRIPSFTLQHGLMSENDLYYHVPI